MYRKLCTSNFTEALCKFHANNIVRDAGRSRWLSGCFAWSTEPTRILSKQSELAFLTAFGNSVMAEWSRSTFNLSSTLVNAQIVETLRRVSRTRLQTSFKSHSNFILVDTEIADQKKGDFIGSSKSNSAFEPESTMLDSSEEFGLDSHYIYENLILTRE